MDVTESTNEKIIIELSSDKMSAHITFEPPVNEGRELTSQEIIKAIEENEIKKGLNKSVLTVILRQREYGKKYLLATGLKAKVGESGKVVTSFDLSRESNKPVLKDDGTVDYKNLDNVTLVKAGEIIATLMPPTVGEDGYNVPGDVLEGLEGKKTTLPKGKGTIVSESGSELIAKTDGRIAYVNGKITVSAVYEIKGDIGNETGNISFNGSVIVRGNVTTDFSIKAEGDIEVHGVVEGAEIYSGGNILITKGISGLNKALLKAEGNVTSKLIQNATVDIQGDIFAEAIMHSNIKSKGKIEISGKKGLLVGGTINAVNGVTVKMVGSYLGTKTNIHLGGDTDYLSEYKQLLHEYSEVEVTYKENIQYLDSMIKKKEAGANMQGLKNSLLNTVNTTRSLKTKMESLKEKIDELKEIVETDYTQAILSVEDIIYPGVTIRIGNAAMKLDKEERKARFRNVDGEIIIVPN